MKARKIAILGTADSKAQAPYDDESWEIWSCNRSCFRLERWDKLFEIHCKWDMDPKLWDHNHKKYFEDLKKVKPPKEVISRISIGGKANKVVDWDALFKKYGAIWFSSSLAYMLGYALEQKPKEIGIWGIDMESREEYVVQMAGCRHFIDMARVMGIKVRYPDGCLLMREPMPYPDRFETTLALTLESKARRIHKAIKDTEASITREFRYLYRDVDDVLGLDLIRKHQENLEYYKGQLVAMQHMKRLFVWNALDPDVGGEVVPDADAETLGPI